MKRMQHENSEIQKECNMKQVKYEESAAQKKKSAVRKKCNMKRVQHEKSVHWK